MRIPETIKYKGGKFLTTMQLADLFETNRKMIIQNYRRNSFRYEEGKHFILLNGDKLKLFKKKSGQSEMLKFVSIIYLWTKEGALLLAKSCSTNSSWNAIESLLEEVYLME